MLEFHGEWCFFENEEEKQKDHQYLELWKFFILKRVNLPLIGEQYTEKSNINESGKSTLGLKIAVGNAVD